MIDNVGTRRVLLSSNRRVSAPPTRRSKNGSRASTALYPRVPGLRIAKSCSASPRPAPHLTRIRARRKRSRRLSKRSDALDYSKRLAEERSSHPEHCAYFIEPRISGVVCLAADKRAIEHNVSHLTSRLP